VQVERLAQGVEPTESEDHASQFADAAAGRLGDATLLTQGGQYVLTHRARTQPAYRPEEGLSSFGRPVNAAGVPVTAMGAGAVGSVTTVLKASNDISIGGQAATVVANAGIHGVRTVQNTNVPGVPPHSHAQVTPRAVP